MLSTRDENIISSEEANKMLHELNDCLSDFNRNRSNIQSYMKKFLECVNAGAIRCLRFSDCTYEINADLLEKDNEVF